MRIILYYSIFSLFSLSLAAQNTTDHIHIDQFGYLPSGKKIAVISNPQSGYNSSESYTPGTSLEVVEELTGNVVFSAAPAFWNGGATHDQSGDKGWWFDFSTVVSPGTYYIRDADNNARSYSFKIAEEVFGDLLKAAGRMFYYNRCNMEKAIPYADVRWTDGNNFNNPLQDFNCRYVGDPENVSLEKDLSGGWFDAGDYNKYVTFAAVVIHDLLSAYEERPEAFGDDWNIPESGNALADIIDEVKWELDWLKKMQESDGAVHIKMGSISFAENVLSPPSANTDRRYYGPTCTSATIVVAGMFAHAAVVFSAIPDLQGEAAVLETLAELSWNKALPRINADNLDLNCDDGSINAGDADLSDAEQREMALIAAIYLLELTGDATYNTYISNHILEASPVSGSWWGPYTLQLNEALLRYTTLAAASSSTSDEIINSLRPHVQGDWDGFFGWNAADLYRSFMPGWSYHWGSNKIKANYGVLSRLLVKYDIHPSENTSFLQKAEEQIHYFHGVNPQNLVYLSNMYDYGAGKSADEIYHTWFYDGTDYDNAQTSLYGPAPGYVVGGSNKDYSYPLLSPPFGQPDQKSYLDFNDGFPEASWEISEPSITYQSSYIRLLAFFAPDASGPLPVNLTSFTVEKKGLDIALNWTTATEINSDKTAIERSIDAINWNLAGTVAAAGNSSSSLDYEYLDVDPWGSEGILYYRLQFIDLNGAFFYSEIKPISKTTMGTNPFQKGEIIFHPNPVGDQLFIAFPASRKNYQLAIFDHQGVLVEKLKIGSPSIDVAFLVAGIYHLEISSGADKWRGRFVKL